MGKILPHWQGGCWDEPRPLSLGWETKTDLGSEHPFHASNSNGEGGGGISRGSHYLDGPPTEKEGAKKTLSRELQNGGGAPHQPAKMAGSAVQKGGKKGFETWKPGVGGDMVTTDG